MNENLTTSKNGLEFISNWEGCFLKPYKDIAGLRTIGIGHLIKPGENFPDGVEITKERALELLAQDVKLCEDAIKKHIKVPLNQNQFDALVSFGFNCGTGVYSNSGVSRSLNAGDYAKVPDMLLLWSNAKVNGVHRRVQGLYNRRLSEGQLFMRPVPQQQPASADPIVPWSKDGLREAQEKLKKLGLYSKVIDGLWGPGTLAGITSFASSLGVTLQNPRSGVPASVLNELSKR
jgi:lysozyme